MTRRRTTTLGLLTGWLDDSYHLMILQGAIEAARECGASLICLVTGVPEFELSGATRIHGLIGPESIDGLIITAGAVAGRTDAQRQVSPSSFPPLPLCSIAMEIEGAPGVLVDNRTGLSEAIQHLVQSHGCRRIGFLCGPDYSPEAVERLSVFRATLAEQGLALDERLIVDGDFTELAGEKAVEVLLDQRRVRLREVDAVVAANDGMALGFLKALSARGIRVPSQIAVVGFDDLPETRRARVPLTTVRQPLFEQGQQAVHLLLARLHGAEPRRSLLPTQLVTRRSCGCLEGIGSMPLVDAETSRRSRQGFELALLERRETMLADVRRAARGQFALLGPGWELRLVSAVVEELQSRSPDAFRVALEEALDHIAAARGDLDAFHEVVSGLWRNLLPCVQTDLALHTRAEGLLDAARLAVAATAQRVRSTEYEQTQSLALSLLDTSVALCTTSSLEQVAAVVQRTFPGLGIERLVIALCDDKEPWAKVRRVLSYGAGQARLESTELRAAELLASVGDGSRPSDLVVSMLGFGADLFGLACLQVAAPSGLIFAGVRASLGAALQNLRVLGKL